MISPSRHIAGCCHLTVLLLYCTKNSLVIYCVAHSLNRKYNNFAGLFDSSNVVALVIYT